MSLQPSRLSSRHSEPSRPDEPSKMAPSSRLDVRITLPPLTRTPKEEPRRLFELTGLPIRQRSIDTPTLPALRDVVPEIQNQARVVTQSERQSLLKQGGYAPAVERSMSIKDEAKYSNQGTGGDSTIPAFGPSEDLFSRKRPRPVSADHQPRDVELYSNSEAKNPWDGQHRADFFESSRYRRTSQQSAPYSDNSSPFGTSRELPRLAGSEENSPVRNEFHHSPPAYIQHRSSSRSDQRGRDWSDYALDSSRPVHRSHRPSHAPYSQPPYGNDQREQTSWQSRNPLHHNHSMLNQGQPMHGDQGLIERSPFAIQQFQGHQENNIHNRGMHEGGKIKKRRGNLPKESTDLLMAWFMNHWERAYPDEPTKLRFCERTGMVMNQVANWFINTRRRKLPNIAKKKLADQNDRDARVARGEELTPEEKLIPRITQERINEILGRVQNEQVELKVHGVRTELDAEAENEPIVPQQHCNRAYRFESLGGEEGSEGSDALGSSLGDEMTVPRSMKGSRRKGNNSTPAEVSISGLEMGNEAV